MGIGERKLLILSFSLAGPTWVLRYTLYMNPISVLFEVLYTPLVRKVGCKGENSHAKVESKNVSKAIYDAVMLIQIC